jgi:drug/metabolite transporter (DMT)-like permease
MLTEAFPASTTTLLSASAGCAAAALLFQLITRNWQLKTESTIRLHHHPHTSLGRSALAGILLLTGPLLSLLLTGHGIDPNALTLALALVPIVAAVTQNALGNATPDSFAARTWPALAALTGLLLLVPQPSFANPIADATLLLAPLATGIGAALFSTSASPKNQLAFPTTLSATALLFSAAWLVQYLLHHTSAHLSPLAALLDAATALLTLLALSRIGLASWSAQFVLVPLAVILQGFVLLRPPIDPYNSAGIALLLLGCIFLLLPQPTEKAA